MQLVPVPKDVAFAQAEWDEIGAWGRALRISSALAWSGKTKTDLAERLGLSFNTVNSWILGDKDADWARWISIAQVLGLPELWDPARDAPAAFRKAEAELDAMRPGLRGAPRAGVRKRAEEPPPKKKRRA